MAEHPGHATTDRRQHPRQKPAHWNTAITRIEPNRVLVRGYAVDEMMGRVSFAEAVYLLFTGDLPSPAIGKINYYMLGDQNHVISTNFDVLREGQGLADRGTFLVDPDGVIQIMEVTCEGVGRNAEELVRKIKAAIYVREHPGQVCPAKWEEGAETLAPSIDLVGKI